MKQYFNIYNLMNRDTHMRMFLKNAGEVDINEPLYYYLKFNDAIRELMTYREEHKKEDEENIVLLVEDKIPVVGTVYNFTPRQVCIEDEEIY